MIIITLDIDWASDFVIKKVDEMLKERNIKATWFVTHKSAHLKNLSKNRNYELGIHPNFLPNTTQGKTPKEILKKLKKIVPNAVSLRTHSLHQNSHLLSLYKDYGIKFDASLLLYKTKNIEPHYNPLFELQRIPFFWEDDVEIYEKNPDWNFKSTKHISGLKIYNFHPIHIILNTNDMSDFKKIQKKIEVNSLNDEILQKYVNKKKGVKDIFLEILDFLQSKKTYTVNEVIKNRLSV